MPRKITKTDKALQDEWRLSIEREKIKSDIDRKYREKYPTTGDKVSDVGTRLLSGLKTFGGSVIGDAINDISPSAAKTANKYSLGLIGTTPKEEINIGRRGSVADKANMAATAVNYQLLGEMGGAAMSFAGNKIAGKLVGEPIQSGIGVSTFNTQKGYESLAKRKELIKRTATGIYDKIGNKFPESKARFEKAMKQYESNAITDKDVLSNEHFKKLKDVSRLSSMAEDSKFDADAIIREFDKSSLSHEDLLKATGLSLEKLNAISKNAKATKDAVNSASAAVDDITGSGLDGLNELQLRDMYSSTSNQTIRDRISRRIDDVATDVYRNRVNSSRTTNSGSDYDVNTNINNLSERQLRHNERYFVNDISNQLPAPPAEINIDMGAFDNVLRTIDRNRLITSRSIFPKLPNLKLSEKIGNKIGKYTQKKDDDLIRNENKDYAQELIPGLFKTGTSSNQVVKKIIGAKDLLELKGKGAYVSARSLSSNSYPLTTSMATRLPKDKYEVVQQGYQYLNGMGYIEKFGESPENIAKYINTINRGLEKNGVKIPKATYGDYGVSVPEIVIKKK